MTGEQQAAQDRGYEPLTMAYTLPDQRRWMNRTTRELARHGVDHILVNAGGGVEAWRKPVHVEFVKK